MGIYNAEISAGSLMVPESRRIARLLLKRPSKSEWQRAIVAENILQKSPSTALRQASLIRHRLETLDDVGLCIIVEAGGELTVQVLFAAVLRRTRLVSDFMRDVYWMSVRRLDTALNQRVWDSFLEECEHRDSFVATWTEKTRKKLFQVVVRILTEAKYLDSARRMRLTPPLLHPQTRAYLKGLADAETLARMEIER